MAGRTVYYSAIVLLLCVVQFSRTSDDPDSHYTNYWVVRVPGGETAARNVAARNGFKYLHKFDHLADHYTLIHEKTEARSKRSADDENAKLASDSQVHWLAQQVAHERVKRQLFADDPFAFKEQSFVGDEYPDISLSEIRREEVMAKRGDIPGEQSSAAEKEKKGSDAEARAVVNEFVNSVIEEGHSQKVEDMIQFNDPGYSRMWYLHNDGQTKGPRGLDINVIPAWVNGYTGKGIVATIVDDGLDYTHPDLKRNYDPEASFDYSDPSNLNGNPMPVATARDQMHHGTRCAGEVAMEANNGNCGVGVAYEAKVGGIRLITGPTSDAQEAASLSHKRDHIDVYSCCWGPPDSGRKVQKPGELVTRILEDSTTNGRNGRGNVYVWASGNGGHKDDDCGADGYVSSIYTLAVGSISVDGLSAYYSESCSPTMAVVPTGGQHRLDNFNGDLADMIKRGEVYEQNVITTDQGHRCTDRFQGTSSAAPLATGIVALTLQANPDLTWRDVQHIVVRGAKVPNPSERGWNLNGAGLPVHHLYGFGMMDAGAMVKLAQEWTPVGHQRRCTVKYDGPERDIPAGGEVELELRTAGCHDTRDQVEVLEHVQSVMTIDHERRGDLSVKLTSPKGTESQLMSTRSRDDSTDGFQEWAFMTVYNWGEDPLGTWKVTVKDNPSETRRKRSYEDGPVGTVRAWSLVLWGTRDEDKFNARAAEMKKADRCVNAQDKEDCALKALVSEFTKDFTGEVMPKDIIPADEMESQKSGAEGMSSIDAIINSFKGALENLLRLRGKGNEGDKSSTDS
ncbi:proprotein convertase subtilisin/kexin type 6-like [Branchiostoma floridae]|uniref:Proprotein convertase subtilisin/kexin type 6-like n=1 Tax=Branchiostoma floridae TaxID=7739 RepID=A0A9J7MN03_BRAFL|nr:proprotein convertase subtilisin/kexin type 6-like [Branchiostoma floridae]